MKISVITVCYNSVDTIEQTIQSVVSQNYSELEYIIIDGGSEDGTLAVIEKYREYISLLISEPDHGIYDAMNKGLEKCTGDIVAFLNSDDWYEKDTLKKVNRYFMDTQTDMVSGNIYLYVNEKAQKMKLGRREKEDVFFRIIYPHPALFVRHSLFKKMGGYDTSYTIAADTAWVINACVAGARILCVEDCFTYFRVGGLSGRKRYEGLKEHYRAASSCAQKNGMVQIAAQIEEYYSDFLKMELCQQKVADVLENHILEVKKIFDYEKGYYIWGAGERGKSCLELFNKLEVPVIGFIDWNLDNKRVKGYPVISAKEFDRRHFICITPKGHESEIEKQLMQSGMRRDSLLRYPDLLERIAKLEEH